MWWCAMGCTATPHGRCGHSRTRSERATRGATASTAHAPYSSPDTRTTRTTRLVSRPFPTHSRIAESGGMDEGPDVDDDEDILIAERKLADIQKQKDEADHVAGALEKKSKAEAAHKAYARKWGAVFYIYPLFPVILSLCTIFFGSIIVNSADHDACTNSFIPSESPSASSRRGAWGVGVRARPAHSTACAWCAVWTLCGALTLCHCLRRSRSPSLSLSSSLRAPAVYMFGNIVLSYLLVIFYTIMLVGIDMPFCGLGRFRYTVRSYTVPFLFSIPYCLAGFVWNIIGTAQFASKTTSSCVSDAPMRYAET